MDELIELKARIEKQDYETAFKIIDELEEMYFEDKLNKIHSYLVILLIHLIQQEAESRTTSSWKRAISNSVSRINRVNKRRKTGGYYATQETLKELIDEAYPEAIKEAAYEAFEGKLNWQQLSDSVEENIVKVKAFEFLNF